MLYLVLDFQNLYSTECMVFQRMQKPQQWCKYLKSISRLHYPYKACDKLFARTVINSFTLQPIPKKKPVCPQYTMFMQVPEGASFTSNFFLYISEFLQSLRFQRQKNLFFSTYLISSLPLWTLIIILVMNFFILHKEQFVQYYKLTNAQPFKYIYKS